MADGEGDFFGMQDQANLVSHDYFRQLLAWAMRLSRRYREPSFAVVHVALALASKKADVPPHETQMRLTTAMQNHLQALFRSTDLLCRHSDHSLLILLPLTPPEGCAAVRQRVEKAIQGMDEYDALAFMHRMRVLALPADLRDNDNLDSLLLRLTEIQEL